MGSADKARRRTRAATLVAVGGRPPPQLSLAASCGYPTVAPPIFPGQAPLIELVPQAQKVDISWK